MKENSILPKKGLVPIIKSYLFGDQVDSYVAGTELINRMPFFQLITGSHSFHRRNLRTLVLTADNNPIVSGVIQKILFTQSNINFVPYKSGKPYKSAKFDFDIHKATLMLLKTGTLFIWKKKIVGFEGTELEIINTLDVTEIKKNNTFEYQLDKGTYRITIKRDDLIIIGLSDISCEKDTNFGLSPLQIALMPLESLEQMYLADTSALKNKGADVMITNDSDTPLLDSENKTFDQAINERIGGARKTGGIATSTAKLRVLNLGRTTKELALWDGYKIKLRDICNVYQVDSGQFNDPDNKKFSNVIESNKALYSDCVIPWTKLITENKELTNELGYQIYLDTSNIDCLQEAQSVRMEKNKAIMYAIFEINKMVKDGVISFEIAIRLLTSEFGYDEQEASELIVQRSQDTNKQADSLNTLSPIVATKVMESTTTNERRLLIGLDKVTDGDTIPQPKPTF